MKDPAFKAGFEMGIKAGERYEKTIRNGLTATTSARARKISC